MLADASTLHIAHDWLDYLAIFSGVGSLALAGVAALVAVRSKRDAERSADAAERTAKSAAATAVLTEQMEQRGVEQLHIMRTEHQAFMDERRRRPQIEPVLELGGAKPQNPLRVVVRSGATNVGSKTAEDVLIMTLVPEGVGVYQLDPEGNVIREIQLAPQREQTLRRRGAEHLAVGCGVEASVRPGVVQSDSFLLFFPEPDIYEIATRCHHHDIPGGVSWAVAELNLFGVPLQWKQTERGTGE